MKNTLLLILLCLLSVANSLAIGIPTKPNPPKLVNDFASLMSFDEQTELEKDLNGFNDTTSIEITIVTINSLEGQDISSYSFQLGNNWGVGKKGKENGVVILVAAKERKAFIATGYGIEGVLPDALLATIVRRDMIPSFRNEQYFKGFENAVNSIFLASKGEYKADAKDKSNSGGSPIILILIILVIIIVVIVGNKRGGGGGNYMSRRGSDFVTGAILGSLFGGGRSSGGSWGGGGFGGGNSGGGGFGGFGGGSFGGGGAGGSW